MNKHRPTTALCCLLLLAASAGSSVAQQSPSEVHAGMQCGGQYECIEDRPLTEAEARASVSRDSPRLWSSALESLLSCSYIDAAA